jgi:HK97 family phage major capsid protein
MAERAFDLRGATMRREKEGGDLTVEMAFASEVPYERWWGIEVLDMKGVRLGRLNDGDGGPVLYNHDWNELRGRHVPGSVRADSDGVLRGQVIIPAATQATRDTIALIESKVLSKASVGYQIHKIVEQSKTKAGKVVEREIDGATFERLIGERESHRDAKRGSWRDLRRELDEIAGPIKNRADDEPPVYRVVDWEPLENSFVTVPADNGVGVGRQHQVSQPAAPAASTERKANMADTQAAAGAVAEDKGTQAAAAQARQGPTALDLEKARVRTIETLCEANKLDATFRDSWVGDGLSTEQVADEILKVVKERSKSHRTDEPARLGLTDKETQRFSIFRAALAIADGNWSKAGFELECTQTIAKRLGREAVDPKKFFVPTEVQERQIVVPPGASMMVGPHARGFAGYQQRDLTVGTAAAGGYLVEMLRNRAVAFRLGATPLPGMRDNVTIPRQTASGSATWLANEASTISEITQTFGQLSLTPKTVGAYTEVSRLLMLQSNPAIEGIVTSDLSTVTALAVDTAVLTGSGASGQPTGITNTAGIGSVTGTSLAFDDILEFQTDVAGANVMPQRGGYATTHAVASLCIQRVKYTSTASPLWEGNVWDGSMQGFPAMASNQMASATMLFGDWSQVLVPEWGVLEVDVNPYAGFTAAIIGIRAIYTMDCGLRYAGAFSLASSIT